MTRDLDIFMSGKFRIKRVKEVRDVMKAFGSK